MKIFVFGSNLAGRHGKGAALDARLQYGAVSGVGEGRTGNAYALPTKDAKLRTRSLEDIQRSVETFLTHARENLETQFFVTRVGCGLAGYCEADIAPMFQDAPANCELPQGWTSPGNAGSR